MSRNPFTSNQYQDLWLMHFGENSKSYRFHFINGVKFIKHKILPFYVNIGKNTTNGITYKLNKISTDFKNKLFLIYDVPEFKFKKQDINTPENLKTYKVKQYKGFIANLKGFNNLEDYMASVMSAKSRNKHRRVLKRFENCFNVSYKIFYKDIVEETYNEALNNFKELIIERHKDLKIDTNIISKWDFYYDLIFPLLRKGEALLISVNVDNKPISMSLAFIEGDILVGSVKAFNSDYYKFNIGHIELGKLIEWCFINNISTLDFSKGAYEYKSKWTNQEYIYNCHILYDGSNKIISIGAFLLAKYFKLKQDLRDINVNLYLKKLKYVVNNVLSIKTKKEPLITIKPLDLEINFNDFDLLQADDKHFSIIHKTFLDLLYRNPEPISNIKIYTKKETYLVSYLIVGEANRHLISFRPN